MIAPVIPPQGGAPFRPWLTYGLLVACAAVFLVTHWGASRRLSQGMGTLERALEYYAGHDYLELDPRLVALSPRSAESPAGRAPARKFAALEQVELDGLTRSGFDILAATPQWRLGLVPARLSPTDFVTHLFLHAGFLSLLLNLLLLHLAMPFLEETWGPVFLAAFGLAAAAAGAAGFALAHPGLDAPLLGASGLLAAVVGAVAVLRGQDTLAFTYWAGSTRTGTVQVPGWALLPCWGARELLGLLAPDVLGPESASAAAPLWAHGTALAFGALAAAALRWGPAGKRQVGARGAPTRSAEVRAALDEALERRKGEQGGERWGLLEEASRSPDDAEALAALWEAALEEGRVEEAAPLVLRRLRECVQGGEAAEAYLLWQQLRGHAPGVRLSLALEIRLAERLAGLNLVLEAGEVAETAGQAVRPDVSPLAVTRLARLSRGETRQRLAALALAHPDLPLRLRAELEGPAPEPAPHPSLAAPAASASSRPAPQSAAEPPAPRDAGGGLRLKAVPALPVSLADGALCLEIGGAPRSLTLSRVKALAAVAVDDAAEPNLVLDLLMEPPAKSGGVVTLLRAETHRFDPRTLVPTESEPEDAFLSLAGAVLSASGASWLLGESANRLRRYPSLAAYESDLLTVLRLGVL